MFQLTKLCPSNSHSSIIEIPTTASATLALTNMQREFPLPLGETLLKRRENGAKVKRITQSRRLSLQDNANEIGLTLNSIDLSAARLVNILLNHLTTFADYGEDRRRMSLAVGRSGVLRCKFGVNFHTLFGCPDKDETITGLR